MKDSDTPRNQAFNRAAQDCERDNRAAQDCERDKLYGEFVTLLTRHDVALRRFIRSLMPANDGVDDVMQETALECWKKFEDFQPTDSESATDEFIRWACVIARFKAMGWQRDHARDRLVFRDSVIELLARESVSLLPHLDSERDAIDACLKQLSHDQRRLVLSVHSPGESVARIARETGTEARRLYSRVNMLRTLLLECVQRRLAVEPIPGATVFGRSARGGNAS